MPGHLILVEGVEGSGKTTLANNLVAVCASENTQYPPIDLITKEPGGTDLGMALRERLLYPESQLDSITELHLFCADRAQHIAEVINPALSENKTVLCDRFSLSTIAYQGAILPIDTVKAIERNSRRNLLPCRITQLILDIEPDIGISRKFDSDFDEIERRSLAYHQDVASVFRRHGPRLFPTFIVDADTTEQSVLNQACSALEPTPSKELPKFVSL